MLLAGGIPEGRDLRGAAGQENPQSEKTLQSADRAKITAGQLSGGEAESGAWSVLRPGDSESDHKTTGQGFPDQEGIACTRSRLFKKSGPDRI